MRDRFSCDTSDWNEAAATRDLYEQRRAEERAKAELEKVAGADGPTSPLFRAFAKRYLAEDRLKRDADGGLTLFIQNESPGKRLEANWLPAPKGPFMLAMRLYWPKPEVLDGTWQAPPVARAK